MLSEPDFGQDLLRAYSQKFRTDKVSLWRLKMRCIN
jgi:hypothetical protein